MSFVCNMQIFFFNGLIRPIKRIVYEKNELHYWKQSNSFALVVKVNVLEEIFCCKSEYYSPI